MKRVEKRGLVGVCKGGEVWGLKFAGVAGAREGKIFSLSPHNF